MFDDTQPTKHSYCILKANWRSGGLMELGKGWQQNGWLVEDLRMALGR